MKKQDQQNLTDSRDLARTGASQADGDCESVAVPSNTAINNSNEVFSGVKFLRWGIDSLYLSYQGELFPDVDAKLKALKSIAQSDRFQEQAQAQYVIDDHIFEVKDKGSSFFNYILEDNAFRIQLSRPGKAVPMAYVKLSSEYLEGDSMIGIGIYPGSTLIVDKSLKPKSSSIVVAVVEGELMVKRLYRRGSVVKLLSENPHYGPIEFAEGQELVIWGVVKHVVNDL